MKPNPQNDRYMTLLLRHPPPGLPMCQSSVRLFAKALPFHHGVACLFCEIRNTILLPPDWSSPSGLASPVLRLSSDGAGSLDEEPSSPESNPALKDK